MAKLKYLGLGLISVVGSANAVVYIGDPSIDLYKQKTDQTFYDMYQNPESALGGQVQSNKEAKDYFNSIPTGNHIAEGKYLDRVKQSTIGGGQLPDGATADIKIFGKEYKLVATAEGIQLYDAYGNLVKNVEIIKENNDWRVIPHTYTCGKSTCTEYTERQGTGVKGIFVPSTGNLYEYVVNLKQTRRRYSYRCGKSTCTGYTAWGNTQVVSIKDVKQKRYDLAKAILQGGIVINLDQNFIEKYKQNTTPTIWWKPSEKNEYLP